MLLILLKAKHWSLTYLIVFVPSVYRYVVSCHGSQIKFKYSTSDIENAVKAVKEKNIKIYRASLEYNIPRASLQNISSDKANISIRTYGPKPILDY